MRRILSDASSYISLAVSAVGMVSVSGVAYAQNMSPSRVAPESAAPKVERVDARIVLPETVMSAAPKGSENLTVAINAISIEGGVEGVVESNGADLAGQARAIAQPLEGRTVTVAELYNVAAQIERLYARNGFILTRATVPPQSLENGSTFRIVIVEGFVEEIDDSSVPSAVRGPIKERLARLVGARGLTLKQIERQVLLAARVPGVGLKTTLVPGSQIGGAKLVLQTTYKPVRAGLSINNRLADVYDNWSFDAQLVANSPFGQGEQFYAIASTASDFNLLKRDPLRRVAGVGFFVPIGADGLTLNGEYLRADIAAKAEPGTLAVTGALDRISATLKYPLILTRNETLNLSGGFEVVNESQKIRAFDTFISRDRLRYLSLGLEWGKLASKNTSIGVELGFYQGLKGFDARGQTDALATGIFLSRQGSRPDFTKANAAFSISQQLGGGMRTDLVLRGQASLSGALPSAAQFSLDNNNGLSGFPTGTINVDTGISARAELSKAWVLSQKVSVAPYLYGAIAEGSLANPTILERKNPDGWSLGAGLRTALGEHVNLSGEFARSHSNIFINDQSRLTASLSVQF